VILNHEESHGVLKQKDGVNFYTTAEICKMIITYDKAVDCLRIYEYVDEKKENICYDVFNYVYSGKWEYGDTMCTLSRIYPFKNMRQLRQYVKELGDTLIIHDDGDA
jgi:hypothetical protein